ncbi:MAG: flagellar export chaperone FliS [Deltaproteobacteria bacterium]|nr:flagellar export chaperone FliS [Deltaproteobacteria bacterium]
MHGNGVGAYQQTNVMTADPKRLVIMCYEGAISNLRLAREKYDAREYEAKARAVQKFQDIVNELLCSLDFEKGGQIATNLRAIYEYMIRRILQGDVEKEPSVFDEVLGMLEELKGAWEEIFYGGKKASAPMPAHLSDQMSKQGGAAAYGPRVRL